MRWVRGVVAVIVGYAVSQGLNSGFVYFWYFGSRSIGTAALVGTTLIFFALTGVVSGYLVGKLSAPRGKLVGIVTAALVSAVTIGSMLVDVAAEPFWHKLIVLLVMAPALAVAAVRTGSVREEVGAG